MLHNVDHVLRIPHHRVVQAFSSALEVQQTLRQLVGDHGALLHELVSRPVFSRVQHEDRVFASAAEYGRPAEPRLADRAVFRRGDSLEDGLGLRADVAEARAAEPHGHDALGDLLVALEASELFCDGCEGDRVAQVAVQFVDAVETAG